MLYRNKKNNKFYELEWSATDCTNKRDGILVYIYSPISDKTIKYVREVEEFLEKFEVVDARL